MSKLKQIWDKNNSPQGGLICPFCNGRDFEVYRTEKSAVHQIRRVRLCQSCGRKVRTVETICKE